ncbi:MAG: HAMP domain-containing histidine kinase [Ilumatobacteraceae bacterium]|nr:HAMP domain-containing histidine kinase [Ilumatobacteraceae bacterium]
MRRRILATILSDTAVAVVLFAVPLGVVVARLVDDQAALRLERRAILAARNIPADFATQSDPIELPTSSDIDYALYNSLGVLVVGTGPMPADALTREALGNRVVEGELGEELVVVIPVVSNERVTGALRTAQSTSSIDARRNRATAWIVSLGAGVLLISAGMARLLAVRLVRPIRRLRDATVQLGTGDFAVQVPVSRIPEIADTASALTATAARLDELVARERAFSADASHQLRTPLTAMRTTLEAELSYPRADPALALSEVLGDIDRLETTIAELLDIARTNERPVAIELAPALAGLAAAWAPRAAAMGRSVTVDPARHSPAAIGHLTMLRHALDVLVDNALVHGDGAINVTVTHDDHTVTVTVADGGTGFLVDRHDDGNIDAGRGAPQTSGRGLALARRLVAAQYGRLTIENNPSTRVSIHLRRSIVDGR